MSDITLIQSMFMLNSQNLSPLGSTWRRWDLHVHTKGTKKNDQFTSETFDDFCVTFFNKALSSNISAIGITDYFNIENYKKIIKFVSEIDANSSFTTDQKEKIKKIFILPNIELRMIPVTDRSKLVNIHCIVKPEYVEQLDNDFFNTIECTGNGGRHKMNKSGIINFGLSLDSSLDSEEEKYKKGIENFVVSHESLQKLWDENINFRENVIIAVSNSRVDGASAFQGHYELFEGVDPGSLNGLRSSIYRLSQAIFSGNGEDRKYFLGKKIDNVATVENKCGSLKPCIHGSDAHTESNLFSPDQDRYCWIKADLTFDGLKQIIYEPEDRVFIGNEPSVMERVRTNKTKYIKSLSITNKVGKKAKKGEWFRDVKLLFNNELVAIIGNKGSGKSAISDIIGLLGDTHNAGKDHKNLSFLNNSTAHKKFRKKGFSENFEAKLLWEDLTTVNKSLNDDLDPAHVEKVKYLPQNYFETLTNSLENEGFEKTLKSVIFLHIPKTDRYDKITFDELEEYKSLSIYKDIPLLVGEIEKISLEIINLEKRKHPSNKNSIENSLEEKIKELTEHKKGKPKKVIIPEDVKDYKKNAKKDKQLKRIEVLNEEIAKTGENIKDKKIDKSRYIKEREDLQQIKDDLKRFKGQIKEYVKNNAGIFKRYNLEINEIVKINFDISKIELKINKRERKLIRVEKFLKTLKNIETELGDDTGKITQAKKNSLVIKELKLKRELTEIKKELTKPERDYQEYKEKLNEWESGEMAIRGDKFSPGTLEFYKSELDFINKELLDQLLKKRKYRIDKSLEIFKKKMEIIDLYREFKESIDEKIEEDLEFRQKFKMDIDVSFKISRKFYKNFLTYINQGKNGTFYGKIDGEKYLANIFDEKILSKESDVKIILETIIEYLEIDQRTNTKKKAREISNQIDQMEKFYNLIFSLEYLEPSYELKLDNKVLEELSPGEKGALLLVFYLMIDKEDTPLIIDQPEDNLDNKSVFEVLTHFIRIAKKRRQIIIVTHNPNLAVGADAEQVINVKLDKQNNYKFSYCTGAIENPEINSGIVDILEGTRPAFDKRKLKYFD